MTGTRRKDGRWAVTVVLTAVDGAKEDKTVYAKTQSEVQAKAMTLVHSTGRTAHKNHTVAELIDQYKLERWPHIEPGTKRQHGPAYKRIVAYFRETPLRKIDAPHISRWMKALKDSKEVGGRTVQAYRNVLSVLMSYAIELGWRSDNPAKGLSLPAGTSAKPKVRPRLSEWDYKSVLITETDPVVRDFWECLGETGYRPSEALQCKASDIFYSLDMYFLRAGMKTEAGKNREVPIPDKLAHRLLERKSWLFPMPNEDRPYKYRLMVDRWEAIVKKVKIDPETNMYQLRKLAVSRWFHNGLPDEVIEALVGHTDIHLTREVYNRMGRERLIDGVFSPFSKAGSVNGLSDSGERLPPHGLR